MTHEFAVTFDYRCPFARNAHEAVVTGLREGRDWNVLSRSASVLVTSRAALISSLSTTRTPLPLASADAATRNPSKRLAAPS